MLDAGTVGAELIRLASAEEAGDHLTHLRLQKLLYYVQGWSLATRGVPMFREQVQAWTHGPVSVDAWKAFRSFGNRPITASDVADVAPPPPIDRSFIGSVWETHKHLSATALWQRTHAEAPWLDARGGVPGDARCDAEIPHASMAAFFTEEGRKRDPQFDEVIAAQADILAGHFTTLDELQAELDAA